MAVSDYKTDPNENTTISGINIAEGCPPSGINNAIRQLMADVKTATEGCLPLAGGTMSGKVTFKSSSMASGTTPSSNEYWCPLKYTDKNGNALLNFNFFDLTDGRKEMRICLPGTDGTESTWIGLKRVNNVVTANVSSLEIVTAITVANNYIRLSNGLQICWGTLDSVPAGSTGKKLTYPAAFTNSYAGAHCITATASVTSTGTSVTVSGVSNSGCTLKHDGSVAIAIAWTAVGRWK